MKDVHLYTPQVGEPINRRYLLRLEEDATHQHDPGIGVVSRTMAIQPAPPTLEKFKLYLCTLDADLLPGASAAATLRTGPTLDDTGGSITVTDMADAITAAKKIDSGEDCWVFRDDDLELAKDEYVFLIPLACESDQ